MRQLGELMVNLLFLCGKQVTIRTRKSTFQYKVNVSIVSIALGV